MTEVFIKALLNNNKKILKRTSKIIALWVRGEIEDLHSEGEISQATMAKLNPLVRHAIYNALFALANSDQSVEARQLLQFYESSIPDYWEEPELEEILEKNIPFDGRWEKATFSLDFLNEQFAIGNITFDDVRNGIRILPSYELRCEREKRKALKEKIRSALKKEGYIYNYGGDYYMSNNLRSS